MKRKLTLDDFEAIYDSIENGMTIAELAELYQTDYHSIQNAHRSHKITVKGLRQRGYKPFVGQS
jgi:hypothetical protein